MLLEMTMNGPPRWQGAPAEQQQVLDARLLPNPDGSVELQIVWIPEAEGGCDPSTEREPHPYEALLARALKKAQAAPEPRQRATSAPPATWVGWNCGQR